MRFLGDECLNGFIVRDLREAGYDLQWILEDAPSIKDEKVIEFAKATQTILISEDKDFGEWVFSHHVTGLTIIFLRYKKEEYEKILQDLKIVLTDLEGTALEHEFITITARKIRRRTI